MIRTPFVAFALVAALFANPVVAKTPFKPGHHFFLDGDVIILRCAVGTVQEGEIYKVVSDERSDGSGTPTDLGPNPVPCAQLLSDLILEGFAIDETLGDDSSHYYRLVR